MIEDIDNLQQAHIEASTLLVEHLMGQYQKTREETKHAISEALRVNFRNDRPLKHALMKIPMKDLYAVVAKACLVATRDYFLIDGVAPQAKKSLIKGFLPTFDIFSLLGDTSIHHHWVNDESFLNHRYYNQKQAQQFLTDTPLPQHVSQLPSFSQTLSEKRVQFGKENRGQDEDMSYGTGRQKDTIVQNLIMHLYEHSQ